MNENIQALLQKIAESEEIQSRFTKVSTPEEAYEVAKEIQGGFTKEEFLEAAKALAEAADGDISDEALASAAGGTGEPDDQNAGGYVSLAATTMSRLSETDKYVSVVARSVSNTVPTKSNITRPIDPNILKALSI